MHDTLYRRRALKPQGPCVKIARYNRSAPTKTVTGPDRTEVRKNMAIYDVLQPLDLTLQQLLLDPNNPRFAELGDVHEPVPEIRFDEPRVQADAYDRMKSKRFDVAELRDTIKTLGYLQVDRIVVRLWAGNVEGESPKYVIVEGNRRVAALKWLMELHEAGRETFTDNQLANFTHVPTLLLDEDRAPPSTRWIIPGLRHVSGIKTWGPFQRARAVFVMRDSGQTAQEVAQSLGLSTRAANQLWRSYLALEQMRDDEEYGEFVIPRMYSYFEEVIKRPNIRDWLGWSDNETGFTSADRRHEFYGWIVGETSEEDDEEERSDPKLSEAKSVRDLSRFLDDERALAVFRSEGGTVTGALSRYESEHQEEWQGPIVSAETTLSRLTPDTLRKMTVPDVTLLEQLLHRARLVLDDRQKLVAG